MNIDQSQIESLVARPSETLNVEVKRWINIYQPSGTSKLVRAVFALYNRNGGFFVIGFDDKTLEPDLDNAPPDVRSAFHVDKVQALISRHASKLFEVGVAFGRRDGHEYPVIVVPEGVRSPVAVKVPLLDEKKKELIRDGEVFFRTLAANGTPSTASARPQDWPEIVELCFDNREADVGRFLRRQIAGQDLAAIVREVALISPPTPTLKERAESLLNGGLQLFKQAVAKHEVNDDEKAVIAAGSWEIALVINPPKNEQLPDQKFLRTIASSNPQFSGWPIWLNSSGFQDRTAVPIVKGNAWEAFIVSLGGWSKHIDFSRIDPRGEFYLRRNLQDDVSDRVKAGQFLDPIIVILRVAEAIAVGVAFAKALEWETESTKLGFAFRWTGLKGRKLVAWSNPAVTISSFEAAHDAEVTAFVELPMDTPVNAIAPYVEQAMRVLLARFGGYQIPRESIEHWVRRLAERQL